MTSRTPSRRHLAQSRSASNTTAGMAAGLPFSASVHPVPAPGDDRHYSLRVTGRSFCCGVSVENGRITSRGTAPYLQRMRGMTVDGFMAQASAKGWTVERTKR